MTAIDVVVLLPLAESHIVACSELHAMDSQSEIELHGDSATDRVENDSIFITNQAVSMILRVGEKVHIIHRKLYESDSHRHFVGVVEAYEGRWLG